MDEDEQQSAKRPSSFTQKLFGSHEYSDFTLVCQGRLYRLHKAVVCPQSDVFAAMLRSKFMEGLNNSINLPEDDARVVHCMIRYLYGFDYEVDDQVAGSGFECVPGDPSIEEQPKLEAVKHDAPMHALLLHTQMYIIADKYAVPGLKEVALQNFNDAQSQEWDPGAFVQAALAYTWTSYGDVELRKKFVRGVAEHKEILTDDKWRPDLQGIGPLMYDVARYMLQKYRGRGW